MTDLSSPRPELPQNSAPSALDNPVWAALATGNAALAQPAPAGALARRFLPEVAPFAAVQTSSAAAMAALADLARQSGPVMVQSETAIPAPPGLRIEFQKPLLQMVMTAAAKAPAGPAPRLLGPADVAEMTALTERTRPGPFGPRTIELGLYLGLHEEDRLIAMAGERMRMAEFVEISAVCVDSDYRGRGLAGALMLDLAARIQARGLTPMLHVLADNSGAIALYRKLGFTRRKDFFITRFSAEPAA